jgi:PAS domain S-box-containing protein
MILKKLLGEIMAAMGFVTRQQLEEALQEQKKITGKKMLPEQMQRSRLVSEARMSVEVDTTPLLGQILTDMGFVSKEQLEEALQEQDKSFEVYKLLEKEKLGIGMEIGSIVNSSLNLSEVLHLIMKHVNQVTNSVASTLMLVDDETGDLVFSVPTGPEADKLTDIRLPFGKGIAGWVAKHGEPVLVPTTEEDTRFYSGIDDISGLETKSIVCVPLKAKTKLIGVLEVINKVDGTSFTEEDLVLLSIFAYQAAVAIENARLHTEVKDRLEDFKRAQEALQESEKRYRLLVENANDAIFVVQDEAIKFQNRKTLEMIGYSEEEFSKIPIIQLIHPEDRDIVLERHKRRLAGEEVPITYAFRIINRSGEGRCVELSTVVITWEGKPATLNFLRDITKQEKLEAQLQRAQKMEAIGTLAGGIAHDFNNILAAIIGYTEIANLQVDKGSQAKTSLEKVLEAGERAKSLVAQILSFSRQSEEGQKPIQISPVVEEVLKLLRASLPTTVKICRHIEADKAIVEADPTKIHQILMNLCTNAHYAMRDKGGVLEVTLVPVELGADEVASYHDLIPGSYVKLSVSDTGCGMTQSTVDRIFDPYFTTKEKGKGTGLGLAVVQRIVKGYDGAITVQSEPEKGTTFDIYLPRVELEKNVPEADTIRPLSTGKERILYVDDEAALADMGKQMLEYLGYEVVTRTSSVEALELFRRHPDRFDLIITDMTMPNMTGLDLSQELMRINPDIPIILCTGFSHQISKDKAKMARIRELVMKPVLLEDLAGAVRRALDNT